MDRKYLFLIQLEDFLGCLRFAHLQSRQNIRLSNVNEPPETPDTVSPLP